MLTPRQQAQQEFLRLVDDHGLASVARWFANVAADYGFIVCMERVADPQPPELPRIMDALLNGQTLSPGSITDPRR